MDPIVQSATLLSLEEQINSLASKVESVMESTLEAEPSLWSQGLAFFLLVSYREKYTYEQWIKFLSKPSTPILLKQLLDTKSDFLDSIPRSVGINLACEINSDKIQSSLDVKQIKFAKLSDVTKRIVPDINVDFLYCHSDYVWVRYWSENEIDLSEIDHEYIITVVDNVYEIYFTKTSNNIWVNQVTKLENLGADLIFCSNLAYFKYNTQLFISNYLKFMWCYKLNRPIFNPTSYNDMRILNTYSLMSLLFLDTNNLSNMSTITHNPLIVCTGERPKQGLRKFEEMKTYVNEGSRAMQIMNKASDFGTISNFIEHVSKVELFE